MSKQKLEEGRPADCTGRVPEEIACYDLLDGIGVHYQRVDHPAAFTMEACQAVDEILPATICKNLFLCNQQKTKFYLLLMAGQKRFQTKALSKALGIARLSFAPAEQMQELLGVTPGSVTVLGLMNDRENKVQLVVDREIAESAAVGVHPCINTSSLVVKTGDLLEKFLPAVAHAPIMVNLQTE
ncbi:MAG: prolyl-tRNA synthetase associated domain-containing protein [Oscillospiraceae bacterium]|nr:prolyl-tRNA synthetase associated domain-containing protein [Oscillospiraceae bacterium]